MIIEYKEGDRVLIYEDPVTQLKKEGEAIVLKKHADFRCLLSIENYGFYRVKFPNGDVVDR